MAALDPELDVAAAALVGELARFVVVGGFAVIANRFVRATEDIDLLVPDSVENDRRVLSALTKLSGVRFRDEAPLRPVGRPRTGRARPTRWCRARRAEASPGRFCRPRKCGWCCPPSLVCGAWMPRPISSGLVDLRGCPK